MPDIEPGKETETIGKLKQQIADQRATIIELLKAVKNIERELGENVIRRGKYFGIEFND